MGYPASVDTGQVTPWIIDGGNIAVGNSNAVLSANTVYLWAFEIYTWTVFTGMHWKVAATATGTTDAGIYDSNGNLLAHTGAITNVASTQNGAAFANSLSLAPGKYYMALCPSNSTDTYNRINNIQIGASDNAIARTYTATNAGTAGVLPNTTGGTSAASNMPAMAAVTSGGL